MKVLYVEDNPIDSDLVQRTLAHSASDIHLDLVTSIAQAQARLAGADRESYDLVLADQRLPDGDGLSLLTAIRARDLPVAVVLLTGSGHEELVVAALKAGADDYVVKHGDYLSRLPTVLKLALERHRKEAARRLRHLRVLYAGHTASDIDLTLRHLVSHAPHIQVTVAYNAERCAAQAHGKSAAG